MPDLHAKLSLSSSARWLACPPSALRNAELPDQTSEYAQLGTQAHALCEHLVKEAIGEDTKDPIPELTDYDAEMQRCAEEYRQFVMEQIEDIRKQCGDPAVLVEQRVDLSRYIPESFGTADCIIAADGTSAIIDYKHGTGIEVSADHNTQLMCYGIGMCILFEGIYEIEIVRMCIFQPRKNNVSIFEMPREELFRWAEEVLEPAAELAFKGGGEYKAGSHCRFCKIREICRERARHSLELAGYDFADGPMLDDDEIAEILDRAADLAAWVSDIQEYALRKALAGKKWPGHKLVEGRSLRRYADEEKAAAAVKEAGYDPYDKKIKGITAMTAMLGKKKFSEVLDSLIVKPPGKPALVPVTDKRPEMQISTAQDDFKEEQ